MACKGIYGLIFEKCVLQTHYKVSHASGAQRYDLPANKNRLTSKNVSIKSSKNNTVSCGDVFNFLGSWSLEMVIIKYSVSNGMVSVKEYFLIQNLDLFFFNLNRSVNKALLEELRLYIKGLQYPFTKEQKRYSHKMAKLCLLKPYCGFRICCRLSASNKRIQCVVNSFKLTAELEIIKLDSKQLEFKVNEACLIKKLGLK